MTSTPRLGSSSRFSRRKQSLLPCCRNSTAPGSSYRPNSSSPSTGRSGAARRDRIPKPKAWTWQGQIGLWSGMGDKSVRSFRSLSSRFRSAFTRIYAGLFPRWLAVGSRARLDIGRGSRIRTCDLKYPKLPRYQTALCPAWRRCPCPFAVHPLSCGRAANKGGNPIMTGPVTCRTEDGGHCRRSSSRSGPPSRH